MHLDEQLDRGNLATVYRPAEGYNLESTVIPSSVEIAREVFATLSGKQRSTSEDDLYKAAQHCLTLFLQFGPVWMESKEAAV
jgi:hypothetical protein